MRSHSKVNGWRHDRLRRLEDEEIGRRSDEHEAEEEEQPPRTTADVAERLLGQHFDDTAQETFHDEPMIRPGDTANQRRKLDASVSLWTVTTRCLTFSAAVASRLDLRRVTS